MTAGESSQSSRTLAWLQLMRLPNVFTAMADVAMGFLFTHESLQKSVGPFFLLLISSSCLYTAGMILNDVFDIEQDRRERPQRPLPSERILLGDARNFGTGLLLFGCLSAWASTHHLDQHLPAIIALCLAALILAYDSLLKRTPLGPVAMGGCRFLNVLLGMSASVQPWGAVNYIVAGGIGVYIVGITWFARRETTRSSKIHLLGGLVTMLAGITLLWSFPKLLPQNEQTGIQSAPFYWLILWVGIVVLIGWRFIRAIARPQPGLVQAAIKTGILSIIVLDAAVVFGMRGCVPAIAVMLLLIPAIFLGRWIYST